MSSVCVEVVYALGRVQTIVPVQLPDGSTIRDAIACSGILKMHPEVDLERSHVGVWNRLARMDTMLHDGDRVEIYRPLNTDPKTARRQRAQRAGGGSGTRRRG